MKAFGSDTDQKKPVFGTDLKNVEGRVLAILARDDGRHKDVTEIVHYFATDYNKQCSTKVTFIILCRLSS